jgi:hypothetical protein
LNQKRIFQSKFGVLPSERVSTIVVQWFHQNLTAIDPFHFEDLLGKLYILVSLVPNGGRIQFVFQNTGTIMQLQISNLFFDLNTKNDDGVCISFQDVTLMDKALVMALNF